MCGIGGFVANSPRSILPLEKMSNLIRHRGPDDEGFVLFNSFNDTPVILGGHDTPKEAFAGDIDYLPNRPIQSESTLSGAVVAFSHRRLSIVDLSVQGHQPMSYAQGKYWIVYNGEIYNYVELREELRQLGHHFFSSSDTEVILAAYAQWGVECLEHFNGMWAFAIYDVESKKIFLARDRFGIKPLYYWISPEKHLAFGSEIKQFSVFPGWEPRMNPQRSYDFLAWGLTDHTDETLYSGVFQLRPGHYIELKVEEMPLHTNERVPTTKWYTLKPQPFAGDMQEAAEEFKRLLIDSVRLRLRSDVSVGSCLSGGLDSSAIVCIISDLLKSVKDAETQKTFSSCSHVKKFDEKYWIDLVVEHANVDAHFVYPSFEKLFEDSQQILWHQDEPFGSTSIYAQWNVFKMAAENGVKVILDGQGADEQLAGYHSYFAPRFAGLLRRGEFVELWQDIQSTKRLHGYSELRALMLIANIFLPDFLKQVFRGMAGKTHAAPNWLNLGALGAISQDPFSTLDTYSDSIQRLSYAQLTSSNLQMLLHWEDRNSMAHSIESRVPYLDYRLVEFVLGLPDEFKLSGGVTKKVQRSGMSGIIPDKIANRIDKIGFATPEENWVKSNPATFKGKLKESIDSSGGIIKSIYLNTFDSVVSGKSGFNFVPWRIVNFGEWIDKNSIKLDS
jgi:asparagine synthase (glutamine-hydrolysing)